MTEQNQSELREAEKRMAGVAIGLVEKFGVGIAVNLLVGAGYSILAQTAGPMGARQYFETLREEIERERQ